MSEPNFKEDMEREESINCTEMYVEEERRVTLEDLDECSDRQSFSSVFGEVECGEPLLPQHLRFDFTPDPVIDNEFSQIKCSEFWDFVHSTPELEKLIAPPTIKSEEVFSLSSVSTSSMVPMKPPTPPHSETAVSMLEFVEERGLIDRIFEAKMPMTYCPLGPREYKQDGFQPTPGPKKPLPHMCICSGECSKCVSMRTRDIRRNAPAQPEARELCALVKEWDRKHPKSMGPPGHPPHLSHAVMQRKMKP